MNRIALIAPLGFILAVAGCGAAAGGAGAGSAGGADTGSRSYGTLIGASYPVCGSQGLALADYLNTGKPETMDLDWGNQRQQVLSLSGEQRSLRIRQVADADIEQCDEQQAQIARQQATAAQQAAQDAAAAAAAQAAASAAAAQQEIIKKYLQPECTQVGGDLRTLQGPPYCAEVPYYGTDGQRYFDTLSTSGISLVPAGDAAGSATPSECAAGYYPDGSAGPVSGGPTGHYAYGLCLADWKG